MSLERGDGHDGHGGHPAPTNDNRGLRVVFDPAIDGDAWPGPLAGREAMVGEAWLGPRGLLGRLETELGFTGLRPTPLQRACALARRLEAEGETEDGFWRASFEVDPLGTSTRLLADRDALMVRGWQGEDAGPRLTALWRVTADAPAGIADRLRLVLSALTTRGVDLATIRLCDPADALPPLWSALFHALRARGVTIELDPLRSTTDARGDLRAARSPGFTPQGDGSLTLLRPHGPLAAADEVAASLAALDSHDGVVVVGPDAILDTALTRHGLPRLGGGRSSPASAALVRLVVEAAFTPMEPADLYALLCLDPGPVPAPLGARLARALQRFPGRGSPAWREALTHGLDGLAEERRAPVATRLDALLHPVVGRDEPLPVATLATRLAALASWARARVAQAPGLAVTIDMVDTLLDAAALLGAGALTRAQLRRLCREIDDRGPAGPAEAGLAAVPAPGAILGPARVIVWWGFSRDRAPSPRRLRLSPSERDALVACGVVPPDPGADMAAAARRWRRPLELAGEALVLVCPDHDERGQPSYPHPLWDELSALTPEPRLLRRLEARQLRAPAAARRRVVELRPLPSAADRVSVSGPIALREVESPSSLERLLGCSLAWALRYRGAIRRGLSSGPAAVTHLLFGSLAHHFLAGVFAKGAPAPDEAASRAESILERELPGLCEALLLPRHQVERAALKRAVVGSAREFADLIERAAATVRGVEVELAGELAGLRVEGRADLLLRDPDVVIDLKWGKTTNQKLLAGGAALQLAAYAQLAREGEAELGVGYYIIRSQELLVERGSPLAEGRCVGTTRSAETWRGARAALARRTRELTAGELVAPGARGGELESELSGELLFVAPACRYCELAGLCGRGAGT